MTARNHGPGTIEGSHSTCGQLATRVGRSCGCAYLADDDGRLALAEILCFGCPGLGVRTGALFSEDGVRG